ncbi:hypothetical protein [Lacinutrix sp. MedPE-SW]|uniref:hypothetical protein n=1 Tax=Lacinutrix sp. MedPE-SW TaxID=1860087 RepID=UPI00091D1511|nr:hypothetical protein [Lacinutrix sp. MedPE-SW]OIQ23556.1 MAG: hypothetical protein BM549_03040 [Lacinutrix sp. MedPE-SW]
MSDKKHIDRLFQEKFKDFEVKPKANVWANIESEIKQPKRKTTLVPLWLRYASVAALLLLFFAIGSTIYTNSPQTNTVVDTNTENNKTTTNNKATTKNTNLNNTLNGTKNGTTNNTPQLTPGNNTTVATTTSQNKLLNTNSNKKTNNLNTANTSNNFRNKVANSTTHNSSVLNRNTKKNTNNSSNNTVASNNNQNFTNQFIASGNKAEQDTYNQYLNKETIANNTITDRSAINKEASNTYTTKDKILKNDVINNPLKALKNTNDVVVNNSENNIEDTTEKQDSTNTIEDAIAKVENLIEKEEETQVNRWSVNANIAPVYYNTLGKGSHIDEQFIDNPKNGEVNTSYGVKVGYNVNQKLKVRSGINKLNLSYDTANVIVYNAVSNSPNNAALRNINFVPDYQGQTFSVLSTDNLNVLQVSNLVNDNLNVALSQRISYYEVPLELEYAVVNKKLGVNVIGGASAFFLSENEVVSEIDNQKRKLGEANNINNVSYSANIGLGIDYKFSNTFKFNLEPTFKYQMNAFSETSGNFKPYIIGVYTGFSYKF